MLRPVIFFFIVILHCRVESALRAAAGQCQTACRLVSGSWQTADDPGIAARSGPHQSLLVAGLEQCYQAATLIEDALVDGLLPLHSGGVVIGLAQCVIA